MLFDCHNGGSITLNIAESGDRAAGHPGMGHSHIPELIMHWMDVCTDPEAHTATDGPTIAANPLAHRDQLGAVWIEEGTTRQRTGANRSRESLKRSMEEE
jgi:hypothetical protein